MPESVVDYYLSLLPGVIPRQARARLHMVATHDGASRSLAEKLLAKDPVSLALTKSTTNALAEAMVPAHVTHSDRDYLVLGRLLAKERAQLPIAD